jgi:hypothetical protein
MNTDFSRQRFDPWNDFSGVLQQQGRVLLDAEWNELLEILDRRYRAETLDLVGRGAYPSQTPDAFKLQANNGQLLIGPGRMYVDGLIAENHGVATKDQNGNDLSLDFDSALAELQGSAFIRYSDQQPYFIKPDPLPATAGPHLAYLDVWQREVTNIDDPSLVEPAVGVDTTTRVQTVWQVRVLEIPDGKDNKGNPIVCGTADADIPGWLERITPSAGRLTTATTSVVTSDDPCLIPPTGGYRSLENRCYRVQIHSVDPGSGAATFKWARDNRSMTTAIQQIPTNNTIVVDRIGWDSIQTFAAGDWVEITDDAREFAAKPGFMALISQPPDEATRTITFSATVNLSNEGFDKAHPTKLRTRIRKWDQSGTVRDSNGNVIKDLNADATGVIPVKTDGTAVLIEDGIQITFSLASLPQPQPSRFCAGDYWVFTARAADASTEILSAAPPRGIHHHYCRLGLIKSDTSGLLTVASDCRNVFPCHEESAAIHVTEINWDNGGSMSVADLQKNGLVITLDSAPAQISDDTMVVLLEMPLLGNFARIASIPAGQAALTALPVILYGPPTLSGGQITWKPGADLTALLQDRSVSQVRLRVTLKGFGIFAGDAQSRQYLDGRALVDSNKPHGLALPSDTGARSSDFESWFYLGQPQPPVITTQPKDVLVALGKPVTFSVAAIGAPPLSYQWWTREAGENDWTAAGTNSTTFRIPKLTSTISVKVDVSNAGGLVTSNMATAAPGPTPEQPHLEAVAPTANQPTGSDATVSRTAKTAWSGLTSSLSKFIGQNYQAISHDLSPTISKADFTKRYSQLAQQSGISLEQALAAVEFPTSPEKLLDSVAQKEANGIKATSQTGAILAQELGTAAPSRPIADLGVEKLVRLPASARGALTRLGLKTVGKFANARLDSLARVATALTKGGTAVSADALAEMAGQARVLILL